MNCTNNIQEQQTGDILQILLLLFAVVPLVASEILPFIPINENGITHAIILALAKLKTRERVIAPRGG